MSAADQLLTATAPESAGRELRAGALTATFQDGNLRAVRWHGCEVLRAIGYPVRDTDWGTMAPLLSDVVVVEGEGRFTVTFGAVCQDASGATLALRAVIEGCRDGVLVFTVDARATGDFTTNRMGFCLLHPIEGVTGTPAVVTHGDGSVERGCFPELIAPVQPFTDIAAIAHEVDGVGVDCRFEGGVFEMEDHRNWSDASFKSYVRPLAWPWPYVVPDGQGGRQRVTVRLSGRPATMAAAGEVELAIGAAVGRMPGIGLVVTPGEAVAPDELRALAPQHLLLHYEPAKGHDLNDLAAYQASGAALTLELVVAPWPDVEAEIAAVGEAVRRAGLTLSAVAVSPACDRDSTVPGAVWPDCPPLELIYAAARRAFPGVRVGGGSFSYFTELNRKRVPLGEIDFITHGTCAIVHAADDRSVMETLGALPAITRSVRAFAGDMPYRIAPATIGMRYNPYGSATAANPQRQRVTMAEVDPRQDGQFAAAWLAGYVARTEVANLEVLTVGALTGPFGMIGDTGRRPIFKVAAGLAAIAGDDRLAVTSSAPERVIGIATEARLIVANLIAESITARVTDPAGSTRTLTLTPYEVAWLDR